MDRRKIGNQFERLAEQYLTQRGCKLLQRNAQFTSGELDLVMLDGSTLAFVEVRYRRYSGWGGAEQSVDARKQTKLIRAAALWLIQHPRFANATCRFDLVAINSAEVRAECIWYKDAFRPR